MKRQFVAGKGPVRLQDEWAQVRRKLVRLRAGTVFAVDLRVGSPCYGKWCATTLTAAKGEQLFIAVGFAHAFCTLEPETMVAYKVDGFYDKAAERGVRWDDPEIGIKWPIDRAEIEVSDKEAALPRLRDAPFRCAA